MICPKCGTKIDIEAIIEKAKSEEAIRSRDRMEGEIKRAVQEAEEAAKRKMTEALTNQIRQAFRARTEAINAELARLKESKSSEIEAAVQRARDAATREADLIRREASLKQEQALVRVRELESKLASASSERIRGEANELVLEDGLRKEFPGDRIEEVPKGINGADIVQKVYEGSEFAGSILWELKRTKEWSQQWVAKIREDGRRVEASVCIIASDAMPKGINGVGCVDGVWVTSPAFAFPLAAALRHGLVLAARASSKSAGTGKAQECYDFLTSPRFTDRLSAVMEAVTSMSTKMASEKSQAERSFALRASMMDAIVRAVVGLWSEAEGLLGGAIRPVPEHAA